MKNNQKVLPKNLVDEVLNKLKSGENETNIRKYIRNSLRVGKSYGNEIFRRIKDQYSGPIPIGTKTLEKDQIKNFEFEKKWHFNKEERNYIVFLKSAARAIIVDETTHNNMQRAYTSSENVKVEDICSASGFPLSLFSEYKAIFGWVRNGSHFSDEQIENNSVEDLVEDAVQQKKWEVIQESKKKIWKETESNSKKWIEFEENCLGPFNELLSKWSPPKYIPVPNVKLTKNVNNPHSLLVICGDWHVGAIANPRYLYRSKEWNYEILCESAKEYSNKIRQEVNSRTYNFNEIVLCLGGDIIHTLTGYTDAGTKLEYEFIEEDQLDYAFSLMVSFINELLTIVPSIRGFCVAGNHSTLGDYVLSKMLETYYRNEDRISFEISTKRYLPFKILDSLVILDHGASGKGVKSKMPRSGAGREAYVKGIFLENPEMLINTKSRVIVSNDVHHHQHIEYNNFDLIISPTLVKGCRYADFSGYKSRPAQSVHVFDKDGIKEMIRFYFD